MIRVGRGPDGQSCPMVICLSFGLFDLFAVMSEAGM